MVKKGVIYVAVGFPAAQRNARGKGLATTLNEALGDAATIFFNGDVDLTRGALTDNRRGTGDVDRARYGVLAEERTLGTTQYLDALSV